MLDRRPWVLKVEPESGTAGAHCICGFVLRPHDSEHSEVGLGYQADGVDPILITFSEPVQAAPFCRLGPGRVHVASWMFSQVGTGPSGLQAPAAVKSSVSKLRSLCRRN